MKGGNDRSKLREKSINADQEVDIESESEPNQLSHYPNIGSSSRSKNDMSMGPLDEEFAELARTFDPTNEEQSDDETNEPTKTRTRGLNKLLKFYKKAQNNQKRTKVRFNKKGQPVSKSTAKLSSFLGVLARNGVATPLNYLDWRAVPKTLKKLQWDYTLRYFVIPDEGKKWVIKNIGRRWSNFKSRLKKEHYDPYETDKERIASRDPRVHIDQWKDLVKYWSSDKGKERCSKNKASRAKQMTVHTSGRKSFARVQKEMKRENKVEPKRHEVFIRTHTRKNGQPLDDYSKDLIGMIREIEQNYPDMAEREIGQDDLFSIVTNKKDKHGHVRCLGLGPSPSDVWGERPSQTEYIKENRVLKKQVNDMTQMYEDVQAQLVAMKAELEEIKNQNPSKDKKRHTSKKRKICLSNSDEEHEIQSQQCEVQSAQSTHGDISKKNKVRKEKDQNLSNEIEEVALKANPRFAVRSSEFVRDNIDKAKNNQVSLRSAMRPHKVVAKGLLLSRDPTTKVGGQELGTQFWEVLIQVAIVREEILIRPHKYKTIGDAIGASVAWPFSYVEFY